MASGRRRNDFNWEEGDMGWRFKNQLEERMRISCLADRNRVSAEKYGMVPW